MSTKGNLQLKYSCISNVPLSEYGDCFTFIVNGEEFKTSRLISDLLSQKICRSHLNDPTMNTYTINTQQKGHFSYILDLLNFNPNPIPENELPFILEVIKILDIKSIEYHDPNESSEITIDNVFTLIQQHENYGSFFSKRLSDEIDFISSNFYQLCENKKEEFKKLHLNTLERILVNSNLQLLDEDQLLNFVNKIYSENSMYSILYEAILFTNASANAISEFVDIYNLNDITNETWTKICHRLKNEVKNEPKENCEKRYVNREEKFSYSEGKNFSGILNHFMNKSNGNISNCVNITASSFCSTGFEPENVVLYNNQNKYYHSNNLPNSWICFDFKDHRVNLTNYSIRTDPRNQNSNYHLKSWVVEGSNDNSSWETIDKQENCSILNKQNFVYTFTVKNNTQNNYQYIRLHQTGQNWQGNDYLIFDSFEIFGGIA